MCSIPLRSAAPRCQHGQHAIPGEQRPGFGLWHRSNRDTAKLCAAIVAARGYDDIDPERVWEEWFEIRPFVYADRD